MSSDLKVLITKVAELRRDKEIGEDLAFDLERELMLTEEGETLLKAKKDLTEISSLLLTAEAELKSAVLEVYTETGEKKPIEKVEVKIYDVLEQYDPAEVLSWVEEKASFLLMVDKKQFEDMAKKGKLLGAPVEVKKEAKCTIATDLSIYLEKEGE